MSITITSPTAGTKVSGTVAVTGQSVQSVGGTALASQPFTSSVSVVSALGTTTLSVSNSAGETATVSVIANVSPDGTTINAAGQHFVDDSGNVWGLQTLPANAPNGANTLSLFLNGVEAANNYSNTMALYYGQKIYTVNTASHWYVWSANNWVTTTDPRPAPPQASADGAYTTNTTALKDSSGNTFSINAAGQAVINGVADTTTFSTFLMYWKGGKMYMQNTGYSWYLFVAPGSWTFVPDPRPALGFYGLNMHPDYSWDAPTMVSHCHQVGATVIRMNTRGNDPASISHIVSLQQAITAIDPAIRMLVVMDCGPDLTQTESANHTAGFNTAATAMASLNTVGITEIECGNEMYSDYPSVQTVYNIAGDKSSEYNNANWPSLRGWQKGLIDGIKSVNPLARCAANFTIVQTGASDMLWNGTQPDGSTGHTQVHWDVTSWHSYRVYGDPTSIGTESHGGTWNLVQYLATAYKRPQRWTEFNSNPEDSDTVGTAWLNQVFGNLYALKDSCNVEGIDFYQAAGGPPDFGLFYFPGKTAAYAAFSANHPG